VYAGIAKYGPAANSERKLQRIKKKNHLKEAQITHLKEA
jgi:hypothetical protein